MSICYSQNIINPFSNYKSSLFRAFASLTFSITLLSSPRTYSLQTCLMPICFNYNYGASTEIIDSFNKIWKTKKWAFPLTCEIRVPCACVCAFAAENLKLTITFPSRKHKHAHIQRFIHFDNHEFCNVLFSSTPCQQSVLFFFPIWLFHFFHIAYTATQREKESEK